MVFSGGSARRSFLFHFNKVSNNRAYPAEEKTTPGVGYCRGTIRQNPEVPWADPRVSQTILSRGAGCLAGAASARFALIFIVSSLR